MQYISTLNLNLHCHRVSGPSQSIVQDIMKNLRTPERKELQYSTILKETIKPFFLISRKISCHTLSHQTLTKLAYCFLNIKAKHKASAFLPRYWIDTESLVSETYAFFYKCWIFEIDFSISTDLQKSALSVIYIQTYLTLSGSFRTISQCSACKQDINVENLRTLERKKSYQKL